MPTTEKPAKSEIRYLTVIRQQTTGKLLRAFRSITNWQPMYEGNQLPDLGYWLLDSDGGKGVPESGFASGMASGAVASFLSLFFSTINCARWRMSGSISQ